VPPLPLPRVLGVSVCLGAAALFAGQPARRAQPAEDASGRREHLLHVPNGGGDVVIDGDTDDPGWTAPPGPARTGLLNGPTGERVTPASEARLLWGAGHLYLLLYAADGDVRGVGDFFRVTFRREGPSPETFAFAVTPDGAPPAGVHLARELDGTLDDARDQDEEWLVEMAVPLASMGIDAAYGRAFGFRVERCDASEGSDVPVCARWDGRALLE
jgi:hypothetical protein